MRKVMLVIDEIQKLVGLESFLRRMGFDVLSLSKDSLVSDALLGFSPEIVIASVSGRNVDGPRLAARVKKSVKPAPRVAICYSGASPILSVNELKAIDALMELPLAGEASIQILAQLAGMPPEPLLEKFRKFAGAKLSSDENVVVVAGSKLSPSASTVGEWDPKKTPGRSLDIRTDRSNRYDKFLESRAEDFKGGITERVMPRGRATSLMSKLKKDSESEKAELDRIQAEKIKFAEAMFSDEKKPKK